MASTPPVRTPRRRAIALVIALLAGCTPPRAPEPGPAPSRPDAPPRIEPRVDARGFHLRAGTLTYEVSSAASIDARDDTLPGDTVRVDAVVIYNVGTSEAPESTTRVGGSIDSYQVHSSRPGPTAADSLALPIPFVGVLGPGGLVLEGIVEESAAGDLRSPPDTSGAPPGGASGGAPDSSALVERPCVAALSAPLAMARDIVLLPPASLTIGTTWSDTATTTICRGEVPITTTAVRRYAVVGSTRLAGADAVAIERTSEITIAGRARLRGRLVAVSGTGRGRTTFYASVARGALLGADGAYDAELTIESGTRRQQFTQATWQRARLRDAN